MADETKIVMQVPQDIIAAQVQAAVAGVLNQRGAELITACVAAALAEPAPDGYGRTMRDARGREKTKLQLLIETSIRDVAHEEAKAWVEERKDEIRKATRLALERERKEVVKAFVARSIEALGDARILVNLKLWNDRE